MILFSPNFTSISFYCWHYVVHALLITIPYESVVTCSCKKETFVYVHFSLSLFFATAALRFLAPLRRNNKAFVSFRAKSLLALFAEDGVGGGSVASQHITTGGENGGRSSSAESVQFPFASLHFMSYVTGATFPIFRWRRFQPLD